LGKTIRLNETLGAPPEGAMEKLMTAIEKESGAVGQSRAAFSLRTWITEKFSALSPRTLAWAAAAAAVVILMQAALLGSLYLGEATSEDSAAAGPYGTASKSPAGSPAAGTFVFIGFVPSATSVGIISFLTANNMTVVDGPRAGGLYRVRVAPKALSKAEANALLGRLQENRTIISMVLPAD
jgi:hypothetical protein